MMDLNDPTIIQEFIEESNEHLADVETQLLEIEQAGADIDVELVNTVFRAVHSVKGTAGFLGLEVIQQLAHVLENVLNLVRNRELVPDSRNVEVMLKAADDLRNLINDIDNSNNTDISDRVTALLEVASTAVREEVASSPSALPEAKANHATSSAGDVVRKTSDTETPTEEPVDGSDSEECSPLVGVNAVPPGSLVEDEDPLPRQAEKANDSLQERRHPDGRAAERSGGSGPVETSIRVPVATLDLLMNLAGELVLRRNCLMQLTARRDDNELDSVAAGLDQVTSSLQEAIMQTRMQAIGNVFARFPRVVRDLNAKLRKQCEIVLEGKTVEVDKSILEAIVDPLTHLVRNAIDHGLESAEERVASGKQGPATLRLAAYHQAGRVCIDVADNGRGIDPAKIKSKAVAKQIISAEDASHMTDGEAMRLIFHPGFSTAAQVTDISGRGVGMDVVRTNIEKLGGTVDVESVLNQGTTIRIVLPLTLAIIPSLIVVCAGRRFAIPQVNILELVRVSPRDRETRIGRLKSAEVLRLRGDLLPLVHLREVLRLPTVEAAVAGEGDSAPNERPTSIIVVEAGTSRFGVVVDELRDSEEIVVKPLGTHVKACKALDAATILGDGQIAWILNLVGVATMAKLHLSQDDCNAYRRHTAEADEHADRQQILIFSNNGNEWYGVPMDVVLRIDRIASESIERVGEHETVRQHGRSLPVIRLERCIRAQASSGNARSNIVVFEMFGREIGLVAEKIQDILQLNTAIDAVTCIEPGVIGSFISEERTVRLLDVYRLARTQHPEWFECTDASEDRQATILVAEDSSFFRTQIKRCLEENGYNVLLAEDGKVAWDLLNRYGSEVTVLVTDVEMPNMNGLELAERVRNAAEYKSLPVIALSSLGSDGDVSRGISAGVDEYHVKFNQDRLLTGIRRLLNEGRRTAKTPRRDKQLTGSIR